PEPWLNRVVAYRPHQVRPARRWRGRSQQRLELGNLRKLSVRKNRTQSRTAGDASFLEQLLLLCNRLVELRLDRGDAALRLSDVEASTELHAEQFVRHVERRHDGDALGAHDFAGLADLVHLAVEVGDGLHERL